MFTFNIKIIKFLNFKYNNCMFAWCTWHTCHVVHTYIYVQHVCICHMYMYDRVALPKATVPIKISQWDLSKSNGSKRSSKYSPIWKIYLGRLKKKKILLPNKSCWNHSQNIKSGLRITWQSLQHCTHSFGKKYFTLNKWRLAQVALTTLLRENNIKACNPIFFLYFM